MTLANRLKRASCALLEHSYVVTLSKDSETYRVVDRCVRCGHERWPSRGENTPWWRERDFADEDIDAEAIADELFDHTKWDDDRT